MVAVEAIWRAIPSRGLAMNSLRLGWTVGGAAGGGWVMTRGSRFQTESSPKESAPDQDRCWASASPKPPRKRWRAEVSTPDEEVKEVSLSVAWMSRASMPNTNAMGDNERAASVEAPSSWVRTCWRRVRVSEVRAVLMEEKLWR